MTAVFPDPRRRQEATPILFDFMIRFGMLYGEVYAPSPQIEAVSVWFHSSRMKMTLLKILRTGFGEIIRHIDLQTLNRFRIYGELLEEVHERLVSGEHWYLGLIGVDPGFQGKGCAGSMLRAQLRRIDGTGLPCYLETGTEKNVAIYSKYGFEVMEQFEVSGFQGWAMLRQATICGSSLP